ncbi:hypothetical protein CIPAW_11G088800 [Carya illinoinensis]|uniref:Uncharacterized protein n=1 Tax=Carya illinoinensis TaxID=32201 RepID=A0A8T1P2V9_CARIL|nr:hypothetical protein CIPAW_11G088800 [Carya illinoinensis]
MWSISLALERNKKFLNLKICSIWISVWVGSPPSCWKQELAHSQQAETHHSVLCQPPH